MSKRWPDCLLVTEYSLPCRVFAFTLTYFRNKDFGLFGARRCSVALVEVRTGVALERPLIFVENQIEHQLLGVLDLRRFAGYPQWLFLLRLE